MGEFGHDFNAVFKEQKNYGFDLVGLGRIWSNGETVSTQRRKETKTQGWANIEHRTLNPEHRMGARGKMGSFLLPV
jgi:hypothetical protein